MRIFGNIISEGVAMGQVCFPNTDYSKFFSAYKPARSDIEKIRYNNAVSQATQDIHELILRGSNDRESLDILKSHLFIISDVTLETKVNSLIDQGISAPFALEAAINELTNSFKALTDPLLKEKIEDIKDAGNRILRKLLVIEEPVSPNKDIIIIADNIEPSVMASYSEKHVKAVLLTNPSETSHAAIIAKSKDFVTITNFDLGKYRFKEDDTLIIDTFNNKIIINPSPVNIIDYNKLLVEWNSKKDLLLRSATLPAVSTDGKEFKISANISSPADMDKALSYGCSGIGLFRTEFLFMEAKKLPSEDDQFLAYKNVIDKNMNQLCIIRTLDIGGDKNCASFTIPKEDNPYLGYRGIRISLENKNIFKTQLKAILRASAFGQVAIMIPMVTTIYEVKRTKTILKECMKELDAKGIAYDKKIMLGIMVETPSVCIMADVFAKNVDFFSIGTNDLIQYTFAADRTNPAVSHFFDCYEPAIIHSIHRIVTAAHNAGIPVGICGEMAANPKLLPFFMGIGVDRLSMTPSSIPTIKEQIRNTSTNHCDINQLLSLDSTKKVQSYLNKL